METCNIKHRKFKPNKPNLSIEILQIVFLMKYQTRQETTFSPDDSNKTVEGLTKSLQDKPINCNKIAFQPGYNNISDYVGDNFNLTLP